MPVSVVPAAVAELAVDVSRSTMVFAFIAENAAGNPALPELVGSVAFRMFEIIVSSMA